jgi:hypothetical protein
MLHEHQSTTPWAIKGNRGGGVVALGEGVGGRIRGAGTNSYSRKYFAVWNLEGHPPGYPTRKKFLNMCILIFLTSF